MPGRPHRVKTATSHFREPSLSTLTRGEVVSCEHLDTDRYGRVIGRCHVGDADLGARLISIGLALAYRRYSTDYVPQETTAKEDKRGMWAGSFVAPWDWRRGVRLGLKRYGFCVWAEPPRRNGRHNPNRRQRGGPVRRALP